MNHAQVSPEQQIKNVANAFMAVLRSKRHAGRLDGIRASFQQLLEMIDAHAHGELGTIPNDGCPF